MHEKCLLSYHLFPHHTLHHPILHHHPTSAPPPDHNTTAPHPTLTSSTHTPHTPHTTNVHHCNLPIPPRPILSVWGGGGGPARFHILHRIWGPDGPPALKLGVCGLMLIICRVDVGRFFVAEGRAGWGQVKNVACPKTNLKSKIASRKIVCGLFGPAC